MKKLTLYRIAIRGGAILLLLAGCEKMFSQPAPLPDSPMSSSSEAPEPSIATAPAIRNHQGARPAIKVPFLSNNLNRGLVAGEFTTRGLDAVSTRQFETDPCHCIFERGTFFGIVSLKGVSASGPGQYAYSFGMAAGVTAISWGLWNHAEHSRHPRIFKLAARGVLLYDVTNDGTRGAVNNWKLIASNGKHGLSW